MIRVPLTVVVLALVLVVAGALLHPSQAATPAEQKQMREALKELQDFIGDWEGAGNPDKVKLTTADPVWEEKVAWSWRFKGDDAWLSIDIKGSKHLKRGEIRYNLSKKAYELNATTVEGKAQVFLGQLKGDVLTFERTDSSSKETQQIRMNTAAEGIRFIYRYARKQPDTTIWKKEYVVATTKKGESLAKREKRPECVVSGGLGTTAVSYMGETFYVCCSGCADAFRENPKKYVDEFKARKKK